MANLCKGGATVKYSGGRDCPNNFRTARPMSSGSLAWATSALTALQTASNPIGGGVGLSHAESVVVDGRLEISGTEH